jgi:tetratricopeptide (TPR) repeat protein
VATEHEQPTGSAVGTLLRTQLAQAHAFFHGDVADRSDPEVRLQLGQLAFFWGELDEAREHLEAAIGDFTKSDRPCRAALAATWLGVLYLDGFGNRIAARALLARAAQLLEGHEPCIEEGWAAMVRIGCGVADADELLRCAQLALDRARTFGDRSLEARALADAGLAFVRIGQVERGNAMVDEAMAMASTGAVDGLAVGMIYCAMLSAGERAGDLGRVHAWLEVLRDHGMLEPGGPAPLLSTQCYSTYGTVLCQLGRWSEAENALNTGARIAACASHKVACAAALADLRVRQGRLEEAEQLLLGYDDWVEAVIPLARLHLARGDVELAAAVARRGLRLLGGDRSRAVALLDVLVEAALVSDDVAAAAAAAASLRELVAASELPALAAHAAFADARIAATHGDADAATHALQDAIAALGGSEQPLLKAALHLELARLQALHDRPAAITEARAAAAIHARIDANVQPDAAGLLAQLGVRLPGAEPPSTEPSFATLTAAGEYWSVDHGAGSVRLRDTKGIRYVAELIAHPGVERHAFDLVDLVEGAPAQPGLDRRRLGDAGEQLDADARSAYRHRIEQLREEMDEAELLQDDHRAAKIQQEVDALVAELGRAFGLGGRDRRAASAAEKARLNVTRAIRAAIARIEQAHPAAGRELNRAIRTGTYCSYQPPPTASVLWSTRRQVFSRD